MHANSPALRPASALPVREPLPLFIAAATFAVHAAVSGRLGFFRDELYFIACGRAPSFGYADQPPLVPLLAAATQAFGEWLPGLRLVPALAHAATVLVAASLARLLAREAGAEGRTASAIAAAAVALSPMYLGLHTALGTTTFEPLAWTAIALLVARAALRGEERALAWAGLVAGLAMEAKYALPFFLAPLGLSLLLQPERRVLWSRPAALGLAAAVLIALPSVAWQGAHDWPFLALVRAAGAKNAQATPLAFMLNQVFVMNPLLAPLWLLGAAAPFASKRLARARFLSIAFAGVLLEMLVLHGKDYYPAPAYAMAFALGGAAVEAWVPWRTARALLLVPAALVTLLIAPLAIPVLAPPDLVAWQARLGLRLQPQERSTRDVEIPQLLADMLGWEELEASVARAFLALTKEEQQRTVILVGNYGEAGALDFFGHRHGLPKALSGHNHYWYWGLRGQGVDESNTIVLRIGDNLEGLQRACAEVQQVGSFGVPYAVPHEQHRAIWLCRGLRRSLRELWPSQGRMQ